MRLLWQLSLCFALATGVAMAQRGGGGHGGGFGGGARGGGFGGGMRGGGGFRGGVGGFRGGYGGFRGGYGYGGRYYNRGYYGYGGYGYGGYYGGLAYWPYFGFGFDYWPDYYDYAYAPYAAPGNYGYPYGYGYATYQPSPNVTVIYPQPQQAAAPVRSQITPAPSYDQSGQTAQPAASPLYLIAFKDHTIRAAISYRVEGSTLHYVTMQNEAKDAPLDTVDRALSGRLNRERNVPFLLPQQQ